MVIYLDNAATTWPKPAEVIEAVKDCLENKGANPGRGGHRLSLEAGRVLLETRERIATLFGISDPLRVIFTLNATDAINIGLRGVLSPGDHVVTTSMEHNAAARPLYYLAKEGVEVTWVQADSSGLVDPDDIKKSLRPNTKMIFLNHASNVCGTVQPAMEVGQIAREAGLIFFLDAAQSAGYLDIKVDDLKVDLMAFPGHKGLYGPQGTGGLYVGPGVNLRPLRVGGTGSSSEDLEQPPILPDLLESGTPNTPGIAGLGAGIKYLLEKGVARLRVQTEKLLDRLLSGLAEIPKVKVIGPARERERVPVVSFLVEGLDPSEVAFVLDKVYNIAVRPGLHCAPLAHKTLGTFPAGTVRASLSSMNTESDIEALLNAITQICQEIAR